MAVVFKDIPCVDVTIDTDDLTAGARQVVKVIRPQWKVQDIVFKRTFGGHMNLLMRCHVNSDPDDKILLRVNGPTSEKYVERDRELYYINELAKLGLAQPLYCKFNNGVAYKYAEGEPITKDNQGDPHISSLVIAQYHKLHAADIKPFSDEPRTGEDILKGMLAPFEDMVAERWYTEHDELPGRDELLKDFQFTFQQCVGLFSSRPMMVCHNDLIIGNIIYNKDKDTVCFIDWEFTDYGLEEMDICLQLLEWDGFVPTKTYIRGWLRRYLQTHPKRTSQHEVTDEELENYYKDYMRAMLLQTLMASVWAMFEWKEGLDKSRTHEYKDIIHLYWRQYLSAKEEVQGFENSSRESS